MEEEAAKRIQRWWRMISVKQLIVLQSRQEFEELCEEIGDQKPEWKNDHLVLPAFKPPSPETEKLWLEHAIAKRLSVLKYQHEFV